MRIATALLVPALLAGCGSTVQVGHQVSMTGADQGGLNNLSSTSGQTTSHAGATSNDMANNPSGVGSVTSNTPGSGSNGTSSNLVTTGVTGGTITLGVSYAANAGAANAAIGGSGITTGSEPSDVRAVLADLDKRGGLLGRKVVPLLFQRDAQSTAPVSDQAQQECSFYTQDHKVFAVLLGNGPIDWAVKPCLTRAGVPTITSHIVSLDDGSASGAWSVDVAGMSERTMVTSLLGALQREAWLSPWNSTTGAAGATGAKVGVVQYDLPAVNAAVKNVLLPGMARLGSPVAPQDVFSIAVPQATSDDASAEVALQNAVLKLRQDGVDHLLVVDNGGAMTLLLANDLYGQRYFPRLAGTSSNGFQALLDGNDIQPQVLTGMVGTGWEPVIDLPFSDRGATPTRLACLKILHGAGQTFSDSNSEAVALSYCDKVSFLAAAVRAAGTVTVSGYLTAVDKIGAFDTARGLGSDFGPTQHDGGSVARDFVFDTGCQCVAYRGSTRSVA